MRNLRKKRQGVQVCRLGQKRNPAFHEGKGGYLSGKNAVLTLVFLLGKH
jgi:hypothetical protein